MRRDGRERKDGSPVHLSERPLSRPWPRRRGPGGRLESDRTRRRAGARGPGRALCFPPDLARLGGRLAPILAGSGHLARTRCPRSHLGCPFNMTACALACPCVLERWLVRSSLGRVHREGCLLIGSSRRSEGSSALAAGPMRAPKPCQSSTPLGPGVNRRCEPSGAL